MKDHVEKLLGFCFWGSVYAIAWLALSAYRFRTVIDWRLAATVGLFLLFSGLVCQDYGRWRFRRRTRDLPYGFGDYYRWPLASDEPCSNR